jgi:hypothetical protein
MSKGGYVDSTRRIRSLHRQQDDPQLPKYQTSLSKGGLLASINKSSLSSSAPPHTTIPRRLKPFNESEPSSSISPSIKFETKIKDYDKQMRVIEVRLCYLLNSLRIVFLCSGTND